MSAPDGRRYAGADPEERRLRRRADLLSAGLELFGSEGFANVSVKRLCDHAGLTQRYFYESFADRQAILAAVYENCVADARSRTVDAVAQYLHDGENDGDGAVAAADIPAAAHAALDAFIGALAGDPRRARIILVEVVGVNPDIERLRLSAIHGWADLILTLALGRQIPDRAQRLAAIGLVGAVTQLLVDWYTTSTGQFGIIGEESADLFELEAIVTTSVELFIAAHGRLLVKRSP
ncbi:TetR/AcrR family transcriptional regulator [Gordonia sp. CPCC 206044]|uniref:TetR/AcrR family transcriptional regulator n=1 Tax=Gordonia sp. CPCC 206044 TaxID=3140793 RepID=UPI003AF4080C